MVQPEMILTSGPQERTISIDRLTLLAPHHPRHQEPQEDRLTDRASACGRQSASRPQQASHDDYPGPGSDLTFGAHGLGLPVAARAERTAQPTTGSRKATHQIVVFTDRACGVVGVDRFSRRGSRRLQPPDPLRDPS